MKKKVTVISAVAVSLVLLIVAGALLLTRNSKPETEGTFAPESAGTPESKADTPESSVDTRSVGEETAAESEEGKTAEDKPEMKVVSAERFEKKAVPFYDFNKDLDLTMVIDVPKLVPENGKAAELNKEMYGYCKDALEELKAGKEEDRLYSVGYDYGVSDGMVAIIIRKSEAAQASEWSVGYLCRYYDPSGDRTVSFDEYLTLIGLTKGSVYEGFKASAEYKDYRDLAETFGDTSFDPANADNLYAFARNDVGASFVVVKAAEGLFVSYAVNDMSFPAVPPEENKNTVRVETAIEYTKDVKWDSESDKDNPFRHSIKIPKIVPETGATSEINNRIYSEASYSLDRLKSGEEGKRLYDIGYVSGVYKNAVSLCTVFNEGLQASEWGVLYEYYYYDGNADKQITYEEYLSLVGFSKKTLYDSFRKTAEFSEYNGSMKSVETYSPDDENNITALIYDPAGKTYVVLKNHVGYASDYMMVETTLK